MLWCLTYIRVSLRIIKLGFILFILLLKVYF